MQMAADAEKMAAAAEEEANEFILLKLADIEGETREQVRRELEGSEKDRHAKVEHMKALLSTEIDRQKAEIATLKTKYISEKFQSTAEKSQFKREKEVLAGLIERGQVRILLYYVLPSFLSCHDVLFVSYPSFYYCLPALYDTTWHESNHHHPPPSINQPSIDTILTSLIVTLQVHLVLNDVVSSVVGQEQSRVPARSVKRLHGRELYHQASSLPTSQLGNRGVVSGSPDEDLFRLGDDFNDNANSSSKKNDPGMRSIKDLFDRAKAEIAQCTQEYEKAVATLKAVKTQRREGKTAVKDWLTNFEQNNGRVANMEDRKAAQGLFVAFRDLTSSVETQERSKEAALALKIEAEGRLTMVQDQMRELGVDQDEFVGVDLGGGAAEGAAAAAATGGRVVRHHGDATDATDAVAGGRGGGRKVRHHNDADGTLSTSSSAADRVFEEVEAEATRRVEGSSSRESIHLSLSRSSSSAKVGAEAEAGAEAGVAPPVSPRGEAFQESVGSHQALQRQITAHINDKVTLGEDVESLSDEVYLLKQQVTDLGDKLKAAHDETTFARKQLDDMTKEKRTDVVARLDEQCEQLRAELAANLELVSGAKAAATKADLKLKEWVSRAKNAEDELALRDENEIAKLDPSSEKAKLLEQLQKSRDDVKTKGKAATAGWNAAATADEKLEVAEQSKFQEGYAQAKKELASDTTAMNEQLEKKEARVTELMVKLQEQEGVVRDAQRRIEAAEEAAREAQQEVADTIATFGGGDGNDGGGASAEEVEKLEQALDAAQDEVVALQDKLEEMQEQAEVSQQTISVLEQLQKVAQSTGRKPVAVSNSSSSSGGGTSQLRELSEAAKTAMKEGTSLWKAGKRSECGELYLDTVKQLADGVYEPGLKKQLQDSYSAAASGDKAKAAVALRKALDSFLSDVKSVSVRKADADAASGSGSTAPALSSSSSSPIVKELQEELAGLKEKLDSIDVEKERAIRDAVREAKEQAAEEAVKTGKSAEEQEEAEEAAAVAARTAAAAAHSKSANGIVLKRAKDAEAQVALLKKQLASMATVAAAGGSSGGGSSKKGGDDPAKQAIEIRRLTRRVKQLEASGGGGSGNTASAGAASSKGGGGGGGGGADPKEFKELQKKLIAAEKAATKKYKDADAKAKKEIKALESKAGKAEKELKKISAEAGPVKEERDKLKVKVTELLKLGTEVESLREAAGKAADLAVANKKMAGELTIAMETLKKETLLRKKYKNQIEDMKGAIRVYARCRPMAKYEKEKNCEKVVTFTTDETLTVESGRGQKEFTFDQVFTDTSEQSAVFEDTRMLVESCLDGYNVCLFAYGQTGSGKTFTMTGSPSMPGLTPRAIDEIYALIKDRKHLQVTVKTYFVELYLDALVDLYYALDHKGSKSKEEPPKLDIKLDAKKMVYINNCIVKEAPDPETLMNLFNKGNLERHVGATKMNAESSRSHSIFAIMIESYVFCSVFFLHFFYCDDSICLSLLSIYCPWLAFSDTT
jgi:hypothetical protein